MKNGGNVMGSDKDLPEVTEQLERLAEHRNLLKRKAVLLVLLVVSGIVVAVGILLVGDSLKDMVYDWPIPPWNPLQIEFGLFVTVVGTVMLALFANRLMAAFSERS